jgi:NTE family protein
MKKPFTKIIFLFLFFANISAQNKITLKLELSEKFLPFGLVEKIPTDIPKIGLALSGGGARSISQLGVLKAIEEKNIPIEFIVGTSMGSIIGGLYSAGYTLEDLDSILQSTNWDSFYSSRQSNRNDLFVDQKVTEDRAVLSFRMDGLKLIIPTSISSGQRAANFLNLMAINAPLQAETDYNNFKYKFRAISSDLISGREVIINRGPLGFAMRASSSVTLLLPPVKIDSLLLVDGGLVANIPAREAKDLGADIVIAVNSSSPLYNNEELNVPWQIADQLVSIPMKILNDQQLEESDFVIEPKLDGKKNSDFSNLSESIKEGYESAKSVIEKVELEFKRLFKQNIDEPEKIFTNVTSKENPSELEKYLFANLSRKDTVTNKELLYQLYKIYQAGDWKNIFLNIERKDEKCFIEIEAVENPHVSQINLDGISVLKREYIFKFLSPLLNSPFNARATLNAVIKVLHAYKSNGYSLARIEKIFFNDSTKSLYLKLSEGLISKVFVEGNTKTKEKLITREFPLKEGDYFKYDSAEKGLTNIRSTNLFDQIDLSVLPQDGENEIRIKVSEKVSNVIRLGFRIDNENQLQASLDIRDENFNGTGTEIGAIFSGGIRNRSFSIEQKANRVFDSYLTYKVRAFYDFNDVNVYQDDSVAEHNTFSRSKISEYRQVFYGGIFGIGAQVERFGNLFIEARYQRDEIKNKTDYKGPLYKIDISSLRLSLLVDSQNDYPYPTRGIYTKGLYETAQTAFGGDIGYSKISLDYKSIFNIDSASNHVITFKGSIGFGDKTLPLSEQFALGGQNSFFGLRDNEYRGRQIFSVSLEYRYKLPFQLFFDTYIKGRYDLGSIWTNREEIKFSDLRHGVGATISIKTPIGPADFSIGQSFYFKDILPKNTIVWGPTYFYFTIGYYY